MNGKSYWRFRLIANSNAEQFGKSFGHYDANDVIKNGNVTKNVA